MAAATVGMEALGGKGVGAALKVTEKIGDIVKLAKTPAEAVAKLDDEIKAAKAAGASADEITLLEKARDEQLAKAAGTDGVKIVPAISRKISVQKQNRHIKGRKENENKGYLNNVEEAQEILDAYHSGEATVLGTTKNGHTVIRYDGVTGTNVNLGSNYPAQPTNVFMI
jgi:hypothetical protein